MRILLVEDDKQIARFILMGLKQEGYSVNHVENGEDGLHFAQTDDYDLAIVDIMIPKIDGLKVIEQLRKKNIEIPVIILSARNTVDDRVHGLQIGGDDYLVKPFAFTELSARVKAVLRRINPKTVSATLQVADLLLDSLKRKVYRESKEIVLPVGEFLLLEYLMRNAGRVVSKTMIVENVWNYHFDPETNVIEARISRLRSKIDQPYQKKILHTVRGFGYVVEERP